MENEETWENILAMAALCGESTPYWVPEKYLEERWTATTPLPDDFHIKLQFIATTHESAVTYTYTYLSVRASRTYKLGQLKLIEPEAYEYLRYNCAPIRVGYATYLAQRNSELNKLRGVALERTT